MAGGLTTSALTALWNTLTGQTNAARIALVATTAPTSSSVGTGVAIGSGYTAGGKLLDEEVTGNQLLAPKNAVLTWTNSSGVAWPVKGALFHVAGASHPTIAQTVFFDDTLDVNVPDAGTLEIPIDGITITVGS